MAAGGQFPFEIERRWFVVSLCAIFGPIAAIGACYPNIDQTMVEGMVSGLNIRVQIPRSIPLGIFLLQTLPILLFGSLKEKEDFRCGAVIGATIGWIVLGCLLLRSVPEFRCGYLIMGCLTSFLLGILVVPDRQVGCGTVAGLFAVVGIGLITPRGTVQTAELELLMMISFGLGICAIMSLRENCAEAKIVLGEWRNRWRRWYQEYRCIHPETPEWPAIIDQIRTEPPFIFDEWLDPLRPSTF